MGVSGRWGVEAESIYLGLGIKRSQMNLLTIGIFPKALIFPGRDLEVG